VAQDPSLAADTQTHVLTLSVYEAKLPL